MSSEDKKEVLDDNDVAEVNETPGTGPEGSSINIKRLIRKVRLNREHRSSPNDDKMLRPQVDYRLLPGLGLLYLFSYLDRTALANVRPSSPVVKLISGKYLWFPRRPWYRPDGLQSNLDHLFHRQ
jgi:hypothetical protein